MKYNPHTDQYEPVPPEHFRVSMRAGGVYVEDDHKMLSFFIKRGVGNIEIVRGTGKSDREHPEKYVKKFTQSEAMKIAEMVKRNIPRSKYKDYRYFCMNCASPDEKTDESYELACQYVKVYGHEAAYNLYEKYKYLLDMDNLDDSMITESMMSDFHLNEDDWLDVRDGRTTQGESRGTRIHGVWGFLRSLPSAIISTIINWQTALFNLIGSIHIRAEKRWKNTLLNPNVWKDFIQTPREKKDDDRLLTQEEFDRLDTGKKEEYLRKMFIINNHFYWAELSNGDVIRVIGSSPEEALLNAQATIDKLIPIYRVLNSRSQQRGNRTFRIIYDDNEVSLWADPDVENAKNCSFDIREAVCDVYVETLFHDMPESTWRQDRNQIRKKYRPAISKVEDLGEGYEIKVPSRERNDIIIHDSYRYAERGNFGNLYKVDGISWMDFCIMATKFEDVKPIVDGFVKNTLFKSIYQNNLDASSAAGAQCFKVTMNNEDIFYIYIDTANVLPEVERAVPSARRTSGTTPTAEDYAIAEANLIEELIVRSGKNHYRMVSRSATAYNPRAYGASRTDIERAGHHIGWSTDVNITQVDPETRMPLVTRATRVTIEAAA